MPPKERRLIYRRPLYCTRTAKKSHAAAWRLSLTPDLVVQWTGSSKGVDYHT